MKQLSEHQQLLLNVYKRFANLCKENDITFFAAYGTLIGTVRHHGFIPWDDDIDVFMLRKDYDRFIELRKSLPESGLYKISVYLDGNSPYPFAKFYTTEGTIWEYSQFPLIIGPWIDVFPLDEGDVTDENSNIALEKLHNSLWKLRKAVAYSTWKEIFMDFMDLNIINGAIKLYKKVRYTPFKKSYVKEVSSTINRIKSIKGSIYRCYYNALINEFFEKKWFDDSISETFEDTTIPIPVGYDELLKMYYGNYMELPPIEKRQGHSAFFMDLTRTLSREEILKENNNLKEPPTMSIKTIIDEIRHRSKGWSH